jgi:hypothetical protein
MQDAIKAVKEQPDNKVRTRTLWGQYKTLEQERQEQKANEQQDRNEREAMKTEQAWRDKNEEAKWEQRRKTHPKQGPQTLAKTYFDEKGKHIHEKRKVLKHINKQVHSMANPQIQKATNKQDERYERQIRKDVLRLQRKAEAEKQDSEPQQEDTDTITKYLATRTGRGQVQA